MAYGVFEGNKYEGHTMLPVIESFKETFGIDRLVVVADAGMLSTDNIDELRHNGYQYILGARIKNESDKTQKRILALDIKDGTCQEIEKPENQRLIIGYSKVRGKKDAHNRKRGLERLEKSIKTGKLTKKSINNRGYNKYLKMEGNVQISIDHEKLRQDSKWDGLKGYTANTELGKENIIERYGELRKIEKAFIGPQRPKRGFFAHF